MFGITGYVSERAIIERRTKDPGFSGKVEAGPKAIIVVHLYGITLHPDLLEYLKG